MKKQWILIVVLAALLVAAVIIASRSFPNVNQTPGANSTGTTQTTGSGSESIDPTDEDIENIFPTVSYEEYQFVMSDTERQAYYDKFSSHEAYLAWFNSAKAEFEAKEETDDTPKVDGDSPIDIGGLSGNNNG